ncbi:MAG: hypothetical protein K0R14_220 [Burkholderiales bacterium]|jgi:hypothetical protein|nr:hypothetical protein [Burkholderiales bacterium]
MKLVTKNKNKFAAGMFWQVPDEGKRNINLARLIKDTKYNMMCQIKTIKPTWGFCRKDELQGEKKVASLGKFIIEASKLSASYANSIICFKFKSAGEEDDDGRILMADLYGYIVLLNGTICPDEGEYVASFELVRESIISQAKKYEIEVLYLPLDVSIKFFSVFENLIDAYNNDELLTQIMQNLTSGQRLELESLINNELGRKGYKHLLNTLEPVNLGLLRNFMDEDEFDQKLKANKESNLKYLIPTVLTLPLSSDEIYWANNKYKQFYQSALIESISKKTSKKYKAGALLVLGGVFMYLIYKVFIYKEPEIIRPSSAPVVPHAVAVIPIQLINACLVSNDKFFSNLKNWTLIGIKCDSLGATLTFNSDADTTIGEFSELIGSKDNVTLIGRTGTYVIKYKINTMSGRMSLNKEQILNSLQQSAINNSLQLNVQQSNAAMNNKSAVTRFSIIAKQSPVYLINNGILDNVRLKEINGTFDKASGFYNWTLQGEF